VRNCGDDILPFAQRLWGLEARDIAQCPAGN